MKITKKHILSFTFLMFLGLVLLSVSSPVLADDSLVNGQVSLKEIGMTYGDATPVDIRTTVSRIIVVVLGFLGVIFIVLAVYAGFLYMTAAGNEEKTTKALDMLRNAVIGLIIVLMAWAITRATILILGRTVNNAVDPWVGISGF